jgi:hypothetical protein
MRKIILTSFALTGAVAMTGIAALPASAATDDTTATVEVTAGALSIAAPESMILSAVAPGATATGTLTGVQVSDLTADLAGWTTSVSISDFTSATTLDTIPAAGVTYTAAGANVTGTADVAAGIASAGSGDVQTATAVTGNNTATWDATVNVVIPADALAATDYTATLTHSIL